MVDVNVSIIIVARNRGRELAASLKYLATDPHASTEVIVVDDASIDDTAATAELFPHVQVIRLNRNVGACAARNVGLRHARGRYVLFLDSDAILSKRGLRDAVALMDRDPTIGAMGGRIINSYTRRPDQWIYAQNPATHMRKTFDTYSFSAAAVLMRTALLRDVGGFWEDLFMFTEEVDVSLRIIRAGYRVLYCPALRVYHVTTPTRRARSHAYWYYQARNRLWVCARHYPIAVCAVKLPVYSALFLVKGLANRRLLACARGIVAGWRGLGCYLRFPQKASLAQCAHIERLNPRRRISWSQ